MEETTKAPLIQDAFDIARLAAFCRAIESERKKGRFRDPYARLLAGERGEEIVRALPGGNEKTWPTVLRTCIFDEIILRLVEKEEIDTVINLGAGLDTRPYRLELPTSLNWIEADLSQLLDYKTEKLAEVQPICQLERIPLDITDGAARRTFLSQTKARKALVITEGLLTYLTEPQVVALVEDLHTQDTMHWWLAEFFTPRMLEQDKQGWNTFTAESFHTHFAPAGGADFFRLHGWEVAEFRSMIAEGLRLRLPLQRAWLLRLLARISPPKP